MNEQDQVFSIPAVNMGYLQDRLAKINKKAKKIGCQPLSLVTVAKTETETGDVNYAVMIEGEPVKVPGYTFVARLDHNVDESGSTNLVYAMPGERINTKWASSAADCGHCGWKRNRKDTFILRKEDTDELIQVGRTCVKDFIGHDGLRAAKIAELVRNLADELRGSSGLGNNLPNDRRTIDVESYLAHVAQVVRERGWVSRGRAYESMEQSSADLAISGMFALPRYYVKPSAEDVAFAYQALEWASQMDPDSSNYAFNVVQITKLDWIDFKATGVAASIVGTYQNHLERETKAAARREAGDSEHVGTVGSRVDLAVKVTGVRVVEGYYGPSTMVRMLAGANVLVTFASGQFHPEVDDVIHIRGTVKKHQEYQGTKQTVLNRVQEVK
jgi:hypothetical protein